MNVQKQLYKLICYSILSITSIYAQTAEDIAQKAHIANINTLLIFTGQEGLTSGTYDFTKVGVDMQVYHLPFTYHFKSDNSSLNYFIVGNVGYSKVYLSQDIEIPPNSRLNYENHLRTYTSGIGGGVRYKLTKELFLSGGVELIYSRSGASVKDPDDSLGDAIEDFFDKTYNDNVSYKFFALAEYKPEVDYLKPYIRVSYKLYETNQLFLLVT